MAEAAAMELDAVTRRRRPDSILHRVGSAVIAVIGEGRASTAAASMKCWRNLKQISFYFSKLIRFPNVAAVVVMGDFVARVL